MTQTGIAYSTAGRAMKDDDEFRIVWANLEHGGVRKAGARRHRWRVLRARPDTSPLQRTIEALTAWDAHVVLVQEVSAGQEPGYADSLWHLPQCVRDRLLCFRMSRADLKARRHLKKIARRLGMRWVLGSRTPFSFGVNRPAILIRRDPGLRIVQTGPPAWSVAGMAPAWCHVMLEIAGVPNPLDVCSFHYPARTSIGQLLNAQCMATIMVQRGNLAFAAGDQNSMSRADPPAGEELAGMNLHLRPPRMRWDAATGALTPDFGVYDTWASVGFVDIAAWLRDQGRPSVVRATGRAGARIDIGYASPLFAACVLSHEQLATGGSDHEASMIMVSRRAMARQAPAGWVP